MDQKLAQLFQNRVSLRRYAERPITSEDLDFILESTLRAPSGGNMLHYSIIKVENPETKKKLSETCDHQPFIAKAPLILIYCADLQRWYDYYKLSGVVEACEKRHQEFRKPAEGDFLLATADAMIASAFTVISAESRNIGSCYIGDIIENYEIHQKLLDLPQWVMPVGMLCLGYYLENYKRTITPRFDKKFIVSDETYHQLNEAELTEMLADRSQQYPKKNKFQAENFGQYNYFRKTGAAFSDEMTRSLKVMLEKWKE